MAEEKDKSKEKLGPGNRPKVVISKTGKAGNSSMQSPGVTVSSSPAIAKRSTSKGMHFWYDYEELYHLKLKFN